MGFSKESLPIVKLAYELFVYQVLASKFSTTLQESHSIDNCVPASERIIKLNGAPAYNWYQVKDQLDSAEVGGKVLTDFKVFRTAPDGNCGYHAYLFGIYSNIVGNKYSPDGASGGSGTDIHELNNLYNLCSDISSVWGRPTPAGQLTESSDTDRSRVAGLNDFRDKGHLNIKFEKYMISRLRTTLYKNIIASLNTPPSELSAEVREAARKTSAALKALVDKLTVINTEATKTSVKNRESWINTYGSPNNTRSEVASSAAADFERATLGPWVTTQNYNGYGLSDQTLINLQLYHYKKQTRCS